MFVMDKILGGCIIAILVLIAFSGYQYMQIKTIKADAQSAMVSAQANIDKLHADYKQQLSDANQLALAKQNEMLAAAREQEQAHNAKIKQITQEQREREATINQLTVKLNTSNNSLSELTARANRLAIQAVSSGRQCMPTTTDTANDRPRATKQGLPSRIITTQQKMAADLSTFAERVSNDYADLASQCKAQQQAIKKPNV